MACVLQLALVCIECVRAVLSWSAGLSALWDKERGVWPGLRLHGIDDAVQRAQRIANGAEEAGSHGGVDGSRLEKAESPGGVAFVCVESS
jgi:hypothetical protein